MRPLTAAMPLGIHDLTVTPHLKSRLAGSTMLSLTFTSLSQSVNTNSGVHENKFVWHCESTVND